ncbi:AMP-dependent synthetase and ligase [Mycena rebaudengoi]|nr:AMP-dependent synthetase and ligase [Mycena rebaudengoi]
MTFQFTPTPESIPPPNAPLRLRQPKNLPTHIQPLNPLQFLLRAAEIHPDKLSLLHPDVKHPVFYSFSVWCQRIQNFGYALLKAGIKPVITAVAADSLFVLDAHHGVLAAQGVLCPINTRLKPSEVAYILEHSGSSLIIVDHEFRHLVPENTRVRVIVSHDTGRREDPYEQFLGGGRKFSQEKGWLGLEYSADEDAPAVLCYTSGTTGRPKGVITTLRGSYLAAVANAYESKIHEQSTYLWFDQSVILPMFHAAGWTFPWACVFGFATQITLRTVDYPLIWNHLLNSSVTHYCGAPTVQIGIVNDPAARPLPRLVSTIIAGAAPTASLITALEEKGIQPIHVYGLTQYGPFTRNYSQPDWAALSPQERSKLMARQGHSFATAQDVRVVYQLPENSSDPVVLKDVPRDGKTIGEIITRGNIMLLCRLFAFTLVQYFRDPEATAKAFLGGVFHSGDLAVMHPDGAVAIVDRSKDIIISGGENASSLAIEQELASHPDVLEVTVVARQHVKWGERPHAFVILKSHSTSKKHAKSRLPGFACPEWVQVVQELPKTSTGKILKTDLRKIVAKL